MSKNFDELEEVCKTWEAWSKRANAHLRGAIRVAHEHGATNDEVIKAMLEESDKLTEKESI